MGMLLSEAPKGGQSTSKDGRGGFPKMGRPQNRWFIREHSGTSY